MQSPPNAPLRSSSDARSPRLSWGTELMVVAVGGALGAGLRALSYRALAWPLDPGPAGAGIETTALATLTLNLVGALLLGMLFAALRRRSPSPLLRPFLAVGVLGSYTTYSTLIVESRLIADELGATAGLVLVLASLLLGVLAFVVGERLVETALAPCARRGPDGA